MRHPEARSSLDEFGPEQRFKRVIEESGDASKNATEVERLIFCKGKIYYDLVKEREASSLTSKIAVTRIEQVINYGILGR